MKNLKKFKKQDVKNSGITLIALIITIIIMLILVAVTVSIVINSGLLDTAKNAGNDYRTAWDTETHLGEEAQITIGGNTYNSIEEYRVALGLSSGQGPEEIDFEAIIAEALANREDNEAIGIGIDGSIVDMSLWKYDEYSMDNNNMTIGLYNFDGEGYSNAYLGSFPNGEIIGTVPQYIVPAGENDIFTVIDMTYAFYNCTALTSAPEIPETVTNISGIFGYCTALVNAPEIPSNVTNLSYAFEYCSSLTGNMVINANPSYYDNCLCDAATNNGCDLKLSGTSTSLNDILATKSANSHISLK